MTLIIFVPALLCLACLLSWGADKALRYVCIPSMLLLPFYYYWKIDGVPNIDFVMAPMIPLGFWMLGMLPARWKFTRSDLWLGVYLVSCAYADLRTGDTSLAKYRAFDAVFKALVPYMAGKLLIERGMGRAAMARQIILALSISCVMALPQALLKINLNLREWMRFFPDQYPAWETQLRWGFGRVAGPSGSPELYGSLLIAGVLLLLWLRRSNRLAERPMPRGWASSKRITLGLLVTLFVTLALTGSRGPWIGTVLALVIAAVGLSRHPKRTAIIVVTVCVLSAIPAYQAMMAYSSGPRKDFGSERETAQYRREMLLRYVPLAEQGGAWGWGIFFPILGGQYSIDNEYLRVSLSQGYIGLATYMLLILESLMVLARAGLKAKDADERHFYFSMLGILCGWAFTYFTVFMGGQCFEFFFLFAGWTQAIGRRPALAGQRSIERSPMALGLNRIYT